MYIGIIYKTNWCHVGSCFTNVIYNGGRYIFVPCSIHLQYCIFFFSCKSTILLEFILRTILPCKLCRIFFPLLRKPRTILTISVASMQCGNVLVRHVWKGAVVQEVGVEFYLS